MDDLLDDKGQPLFVKTPLWILRDIFPRLSPRAREMFIILLRFADLNTTHPSVKGRITGRIIVILAIYIYISCSLI